MGNRNAPWWQPGRYAARRASLMLRARLTAALRDWFAARDFVEVETPALQISPGLEPHLHAFATDLDAPDGARRRLYLHTSPEFAMKKLLAAGEARIFQLAHVFRNAERSDTHHPEFAMLEWYRAGTDYAALMADCADLLRALAGIAERPIVSFRAMSCDLTVEPERLSLAEAFDRYAGIDLLASAPDPLIPDVDRLARAAMAVGIAPHEGDSWEDLFFRILFERIEPHLGSGRPTILMQYPVSMAALARPSPIEPRVAERFELYVAGVELANAFSELTDPAVQRARFEADMEVKQRLYGQRYPIDEDFLAALAIMPDAAGIALGWDRLVMLLAGKERIDDVLWAPVAET